MEDVSFTNSLEVFEIVTILTSSISLHEKEGQSFWTPSSSQWPRISASV